MSATDSRIINACVLSRDSHFGPLYAGCIYGFLEDQPNIDIRTSPIVEYSINKDRKQITVFTKSGSEYRIVVDNEHILEQVLSYMDDI